MMRIAGILICLAGPLAAQDASAMLDAAKTQLAAAQTGQDRIAALTQTVQAYEAGLAAVRQEQRQLAQEQAALDAQLQDQRAEIGQLIGVLATIGRTPAPVRNSHPDGPVASLRAGMLTADLVPALQARALDVQALSVAANEANAAVTAIAQTLSEGLQAAQSARSALGQAMSERRAFPMRFADDPVQSALLVAAATDLDGFARQVTAARAGGQGQVVTDGALPLPVSGRVRDDGDGIRIFAPAGALVTAPVAATVLFQGPLLDYGQIVILEPAADIIFVLGGLNDVFVTTGEIVAEGAAIGLLAGSDTGDDGNLSEKVDTSAGNMAQSLYLEVREGQTTINPDTWFALDETRN